jgi:hypothetical protein
MEGAGRGPDEAKRWGAHGEGRGDRGPDRKRVDVEFGTRGGRWGPDGRGGYTH